MSIPTGGAGGFAKGAGGATSNAGVTRPGKDAAADAAQNMASGLDAATHAAGKEHGQDTARQPGFGSGGGFGAWGGSGGSATERLDPTAQARKLLEQAPPAAALGAGGTSAAADPDAQGGSVGRAGGTGKVVGAAAALPAVNAAGQILFAMMILNWLKSMFFASLAFAANVLNMILGAVMAGLKWAVGGFMAAGSAISSFVGGAVSAGVAAVGTGVSVLAAASLVAVSAITGISHNTAERDGALFDCSADVIAAVDSVATEPDGGSEASTLANAKLIYSVLSAWGMPDENIAGILGNWDAESGIDPTGVETIMGEPHTVGTKKQAAEGHGFDVTKVAPEYGARFPGVKLLGIGLGQWSNDRNTQLRNYARGEGKWATLETQLGFMISEDSGAPVIRDMIENPVGSPAAAAVFFHDEWERSADSSMARREERAVHWFAQMGGWEKNQELADSILEQSGSTLEDANQNRISSAKASCRTDGTVTAGLQEGGLDLEQAEALMATYRSEGDAVLAEAFGAGGPGDCGFGKADNCVGFSSYFVWKFTSFKGYARGNGIDTAASLASLTDRSTSTTPTPYSVFSMSTSAPEGHTGVILGIQGDMAIIGEASCGSNHAGTRAFTQPLSELTSGNYVFTDVSDLITDEAIA